MEIQVLNMGTTINRNRTPRYMKSILIIYIIISLSIHTLSAQFTGINRSINDTNNELTEADEASSVEIPSTLIREGNRQQKLPADALSGLHPKTGSTNFPEISQNYARPRLGDEKLFDPFADPDYYDEQLGGISFDRENRRTAAVPEPSTYGLFAAMGLISLILSKKLKVGLKE